MGYQIKGKSAIMIFERHANLKYKLREIFFEESKYSGVQSCNNTEVHQRARKRRSNYGQT